MADAAAALVAGAAATLEDDATISSEEHVHEAEHLMALSVATMILLNIVSLGIGQWLHSKHIYWLPECGATILVGFFAGWWVSKHLPPDVERKETNLYFDPTFFTLFLLPPIIFEAGYSLNMPLFGRNLGKILLLAIFGTLFATALTWFALYTNHTDFLIDLGFSESGQFAALISAVDPVATLSLFSALSVDPNLNNIIVGESVLNDAVALITFRAITHYGVNLKNEYESIILSFLITGLGSAILGVVVGGIAALSFKWMGMGRRADLPHVECCIFAAYAYGSFVCAELPENSGIVAAMFAGFTMRAFARPNLSPGARQYVDILLKVMATFADNIIYLLVGFALTIEIPYVLRPDLPGTTLALQQSASAFVYVISLCVIVRALHVFPILGATNLCTPEERRVPFGQQVICWFSGLRGAIAVALSYQVVGPNAHVIRAATMFVVVATTFFFGGSTKCLLDAFKVPTGVPETSPEMAVPTANDSSVYATIYGLLVDRHEDAYKQLPKKGQSPARV
jgi:sodium/hydrogen exchanger 8